MTIILHVEGATEEELARGVAAAEAVFERAGIQPWRGALGVYEREMWDRTDFDEATTPTGMDREAAEAMREARDAALKACCEGWSEIPVDARLDIIPTHEL